MELQTVQAKLEGAFDSVSETNDDTFMARLNKTDYKNRNEAVDDIQKRLRNIFPDAKVQSHGSVGRPVIQWYIEFTL